MVHFKVGARRWIEHLAKISQSIKNHVGTLQKCSGMIPKRSGNRFEQLVGSHYSIWVQNPNGFLTISCDFASDSDSDLKLDQFGVACGSLPIVSRTQIEFFIKIFLEQPVFHLIRTLVQF